MEHWSLVGAGTMRRLAVLRIPTQIGSGLIDADGFQSRFQPAGANPNELSLSEASRTRCSACFAEERGTFGEVHRVRNSAL